MAQFSEPIMRDQLPEDQFEPVPAGSYSVQITESGMKQTSSGGKMLTLGYTILDGACARRKLRDSLNLYNANQKAEQIAWSNLRKIMTACNLAVINDSDELLGRSMNVTVTVEPAKGEYGPSNRVKGYSAMFGNVATLPPAFNQAPANPVQEQRPAVTSAPQRKSNKPDWL